MVDLINPSLFGIVPATENQKKTQFCAWHRPRKQWVRVRQWQYWTNILLKTSAYKNINELQYFGFPGEDCLDIHVLGQNLPEGKKFVSMPWKVVQVEHFRSKTLYTAN